jgi:hypothetical protein
MAYEIFTRKVTRSGAPTIAFNTLGRISLNQSATRQFLKEAVEWVLLLWDRQARKVALRPITKKDARAYRVSYYKKSNGCGFSAKTFFDHIGIDYSASFTVAAEWNEEEGILEATLPEEKLKDERQQKLMPMETPNKRSRSA